MEVRITKLVHACLLVESAAGTVLVDPGKMTQESGLLKASMLSRLDAIAITHEHFDHFSLELVTDLLKKFPEVPIVSTHAVLQNLLDSGIKTGNTSPLVSTTQMPHESMEPLKGGQTVDNLQLNIMDLLTHPGDSLMSSDSNAIYAMPLAGPWGSAIDAIRLAEKLGPKYVIPIHDWMWNDSWRLDMYERCKNYFASIGIEFIVPTDGQASIIKL
ncbi:MAG: MBL fold metallo-hydrolase [bacterium]|nr:MBL fold metallo-hydrolase [bacterium]